MMIPTAPVIIPQKRRRSGRLAVLVVILAIIAMAAVAIAPAFVRGAERRERRKALTPDKAVEGLRIPAFTLTTQIGETVDEGIFEGRVTIVDFVFTNCTFVCPTLTQKMLYLQEQLSGTDCRLVSISVDPERDTPERLAEHARRIGADTARWTFLTGPWEQVLAISEGGLALGLGPDPNPENVIVLDDGSTMQNISHTTRLVLVGPDGAVLGLYAGLEQADVDRLAARAKIAADSHGTRANRR